MFEKIRNLKNKKGFTLVELIVVLVILAILAAPLVPALTGYIDRANKQAIIAETRSVVMATQTIASEKYAALKTGESLDTLDSTALGDVKTLAETTNAPTDVVIENGKVKSLKYTDGKKTCSYNADGTGTDGKYTVS